jgi:phosphatidylethanolamine/phosphatidyl-N-methylethanolamine N-methyltransferase
MSVENAERIYDSYSGIYDLIFRNILQPGREMAVSALGIRPGHHVLEVGVGTGLSLPYYPLQCRLTGIDISAEMLKHAEIRAREHGLSGARFLRMGAEEMDLPDASFDSVLATYVLSTVSDPGRVLSELRRVCRPGGRVVVLNHFGSRNRLVALGERALTPISRRLGFVLNLSMENLLDGGGFTLERLEKVNIPPFWSLVVLSREKGAGVTAPGNGNRPPAR